MFLYSVIPMTKFNLLIIIINSIPNSHKNICFLWLWFQQLSGLIGTALTVLQRKHVPTIINIWENFWYLVFKRKELGWVFQFFAGCFKDLFYLKGIPENLTVVIWLIFLIYILLIIVAAFLCGTVDLILQYRKQQEKRREIRESFWLNDKFQS